MKFFPIHVARIRRKNHNTAPIIGARNINIIVLVQPERITTLIPPLAIADQRYPQRSACDELVGSQSHQVIRFQDIAPINPKKITIGVTNDISIIPFPIVFATAVPTMAIAEKLKKAAHMTAFLGESTRVATIVAIEFALSCIPFVKSNISAIIIINITNG